MFCFKSTMWLKSKHFIIPTSIKSQEPKLACQQIKISISYSQMKILNADIVRTQRLFLPHNNSGQSEEILAHHCQVIWNINKIDYLN